jgi:polar amino acid transport system substrate-binding protein
MMFPRLIVLALLIVMVTGCGSSETDDGVSPAKRTVLRIGTDATYPPFEMVATESGQPAGFDIDLITEICVVNGWRPEFIVTPFDGIIPGLTGDKYDVVISAMTITANRAAVVDFSDPYYLAGQTIAVPLNDTSIAGVDDLIGQRVGVQLGTTGELMAKEIDGLQVFSYDNIGAAFIDMDNGNLDAVLNDFPTTQAYINRQGKARTVGEILSTEHYGMAVKQGSAELLRQINSALATIRQSGRYDEIHIEWFGAPPVSPPPADEDSVGTL